MAVLFYDFIMNNSDIFSFFLVFMCRLLLLNNIFIHTSFNMIQLKYITPFTHK